MEADKILEAAARIAQQQGQAQPSGVQPTPVPMSVQMTTARGGDGQSYVLLVIQTPVGQNVFFFDPDGAENIAKGLEKSAVLARTGLEIPNSLG